MRHGWGRWAAAVAVAWCCGSAVPAQTGKKSAKVDAAPAADLPAGAESITLSTEDGVYLVGTYFKAKPGKATGVVVIPNLRTNSQREFYPLALKLVEDGVSVFTFDFRGFGQSTALAPDSPLAKRQGGDTPKLRNEDILRNPALLLGDFDAVKQFLLMEHNAGKLNIRQYGMLAMGDLPCAAAYLWLSTREFGAENTWTRQGGDIAAICFVSPALGYKTLRISGTPGFPGDWGARVPIMVVAAAGKTPSSDAAEKLARGLKLAVLTDAPAIEDKKFRKDSGWLKVPVAAAKGKAADLGIELLRAAEQEKTRAAVRGFLQKRLAARKEAPWESGREINDDVKIAIRKGGDDK